MEAGNKQSASSFTNNLFGAKDSSPSSHILTSIFAPPPHQVRGGENEKSSGSVTQASTAKTPLLGDEEKKIWSKDKSSSRFPEQKIEPFHYSSSIYYGGQDVYYQPHTAPNTTTTYNKDGGEEEDDDSGSASRGNWWQGRVQPFGFGAWLVRAIQPNESGFLLQGRFTTDACKIM